MPMVEQSTSIFGICFRPSRNMPSGPKQTSARSLPVLSMVKSTSTSASSERASTTFAPFSSAVSALARVRFQIETSYPALTQPRRHRRTHAPDADPSDLHACLSRSRKCHAVSSRGRRRRESSPTAPAGRTDSAELKRRGDLRDRRRRRLSPMTTILVPGCDLQPCSRTGGWNIRCTPWITIGRGSSLAWMTPFTRSRRSPCRPMILPSRSRKSSKSTGRSSSSSQVATG